MTLPAFMFVLSRRDEGLVRCQLSPESVRSAESRKKRDCPVVYVVRDAELAPLRRLPGVVDRGTKHKARPLSLLFLGYPDRIPVLSGSYVHCGQFERSVWTFLKKAEEKRERNAYILGVNEPVFGGLLARASEKEISSQKQAAAVTPPDASSTGDEIIERILDGETVDPRLIKDFHGESPRIRLVRALVMRAAKTNSPVLILGESGTGKEIVARAIHRLSRHSRQKFVAVNCAAIPSELMESELFGHVKGAFNDAREKVGLWEDASGGTLFLDEIGDLSLNHQAKILRALSDGEIRRMGGNQFLRVDARVIAATHRDLSTMAKEGTFRDDLYYRLRCFLIRTPSLRELDDDKERIASFLWRSITGDDKATLPRDILDFLLSHHWVGNVRDLRSILSQLHDVFGSTKITARDLGWMMEQEGRAGRTGKSDKSPGAIYFHRFDCLQHLRRAGDIVRAVKTAVRPITRDNRTDAATVASVQSMLCRHLEEMEMLCLHQLLFHSERTFQASYRLKGKLSNFLERLAVDVQEATSYWQREVKEEIKLASHALFEEVAALERD